MQIRVGEGVDGPCADFEEPAHLEGFIVCEVALNDVDVLTTNLGRNFLFGGFLVTDESYDGCVGILRELADKLELRIVLDWWTTPAKSCG